MSFFSVSLATRSIDEELIEETIHQEQTTVTSHKHASDTSPAVEIRTERVRTVTTRQKSRGNIFQGHSGESMRIHVTPEDSTLDNTDNFRLSSKGTFITNHAERHHYDQRYSSATSRDGLPTIS